MKMQAANAVKKLTKAGFTIAKNGNRYNATANGQVIRFIEQSDRIICINVRSANDHDDAMTDYSAGVYCDNITQAIRLAH
jgi:hypothetical protein